MENISKKMAKGAAWMVAFKMVERSIGLISTIILARLLEPDDFGLVAMATAFLALLMLLTSFNFDVALIQKQDAARGLYDTAWTFNVIFGGLLSILLIISAIPLADLYKEPRLENILYVLAFNTVVGGFANIGPVAFRKELKFHLDFYFMLAKKLVGFFVCIYFAFALRNYWALVLGTLVGNVFSVLLSYRIHPYRPRFSFSNCRELFGFSGWIFLVNMIYFLCNRAPEFVVGKLVGLPSLGIYNIANEVASLPVSELVQPINRATFPAYSMMKDNDIELASLFIKTQSIISIFVFPIGAGLILTADLFVPILLGDKWLDVIPLIRLFALYGVFMAIQSNASTIYLAKGKPRIQALLSGFYMSLLLPTMFFLTKTDGIYGSALAVAFAIAVVTPISLWMANRLLHLGFFNFLDYTWRPLVATTVMAFALDFIKDQIALPAWLQLVTLVMAGALFYAVLILTLWALTGFRAGAESIITNYMKDKFVTRLWRARYG